MNSVTKKIFTIALPLWLASGVYSFWAPAAKGFLNGDLARIIFWHLPPAFICAALILVAPFYAWKAASKEDEMAWRRLNVAWEMATLMGVLALTTGIVFSKTQWGEWWDWDPRQTSFLFVVLLLSAGLALRGGIPDGPKRKSAVSGYALMTFLPIMFLIFVFPRLPSVGNLHPNTAIQRDGFDMYYKIGLYTMLGAMTLFLVGVGQMRMRLFALEAQLDKSDGHLETHRNGTSPDGAPRPVVVHRRD